MAFWSKFMAPPTVSSIDALLNALPPQATTSPPPAGPCTPSLSPADLALYESTLDSLLANQDLLSEIKSGANARLTDFLARAEVIHRLGGWVVWGLGGEQEEEVAGGGIISDDVEDGKVPDFVVAPGVKKKAGMGNVPRRRDMDEMGVLEGGEPETEQEKSWAGFPRLATEILSSDVPSFPTVLFDPSSACSQPQSCPTPASFLVPFWETLLRSTELQLETRGVQVGYWARVNANLLNDEQGVEALTQILTIPNLLPRLLTLLPYCSPINDTILTILRISAPPSPFLSSLVPSALRLLDPLNTLGKEGHAAAEELLRGVIELCSAAPAQVPPAPGPGGPGQAPQEIGFEFKDNSLARQLADARTVKTMLDWMMTGIDSASLSDSTNEATPRLSTIPLSSGPSEEKMNDLRTSSLIQSISVLVELIRKNNSDFIEQQMLTWARRKEGEETERELLESDSLERLEGETVVEADKGPSLVDLSGLLSVVSSRLHGLQQLMKTPRSLKGSVETTAGSITPLTLERFRICEFYAELLHCSNMSLLNRPPSYQELYDKEGYLARGWKAADELAEAVAGPPPEEEDRHAAFSTSPGSIPTSQGRSSSPIDVPATYSGLSTPSGHGSLDSESGILTRAEAKELRDLVAAAAEDEDDKDPFGDPEDSTSDADLAEATGAIDLDGDLNSTKEPPTLEDSVPSLKTLQDDTPFATPAPAPQLATPLPSKPLPPGPQLKIKFMEEKVVETILDLFFELPWNNFLHNVVFDILQQIFHGRLDRPLDRQLALSVFLDGKLIDRILAGQAANDEGMKERKIRLGYMGHMTLVADLVVKLFDRNPKDIYAAVAPHIPQPAWDQYVTTTLRETRDRDLSPLGGGILVMPPATASTANSLSDDDDEFPMASARTLRAMETSNPAGGGAATDEGAFGGHAKASTSTDASAPGDQFSRYLRNEISSDPRDNFGSSDEDDDEDDAQWLGGSHFDPGDVDFALADQPNPKRFEFDDRFESTGRQVFQSGDSDDDADWGPFTADSSKASPFAGDDFRPTVASTSAAAGFDDGFGDDNFGTSSALDSASTGADDDDFGDFETASPSITIPSMDSLEDFDFQEDARSGPGASVTISSFAPTAHTASRPVFARSVTADDGSALFGGLSSSLDDSSSNASSASNSNPTSPRSPTRSTMPSLPSFATPPSPSLQADLATSLEEPLGPSMHENSKLTADGFVEATVDGKTVKVPADEIALAHRRSSSESMERPIIRSRSSSTSSSSSVGSNGGRSGGNRSRHNSDAARPTPPTTTPAPASS